MFAFLAEHRRELFPESFTADLFPSATGRPSLPADLVDDFTVDEEHCTVTCPAGQVRPMSKSRTVTFGAACAACPLRQRCTTAKD